MSRSAAKTLERIWVHLHLVAAGEQICHPTVLSCLSTTARLRAQKKHLQSLPPALHEPPQAWGVGVSGPPRQAPLDGL